MAYTFSAPGPGNGNDVDFDFFDEPGGKDSPTTFGNSGNWQKKEKSQSDRQSTESKSDTKSRSSVDRHKSPRGSARSDTDSSDYSSDSSYTDSDSDSYTPSTGSRNVVRIEAKLPRVETEKGDSDNDHLSPSHGRSKSPNAQKSRTKTGHHKLDRGNGRQRSSHSRSRSVSTDSYSSDSDSLTDTDSDVTDVSPLHSPHNGNGHKSSTRKEVTFRRPPSGSGSNRSKESARYPLFKADRDDIDLRLLMQAVMEMEQKRNPRIISPVEPQRQTFSLPRHNPTSFNRKNFSFTNDSVRTIDKENQRLMEQIMRNNMKSKKKRSIKPNNIEVGPKRMSTSAINRNREQLRIERENFELLTRIHTAKPTKETIKNDLMDDYSKQVLFGSSVAEAHHNEKKKKGPSPYTTGFHPQFSASGDLNGSMKGKRTRPVSATVRPSRPISAVNQRTRPQSAKNRPLSATVSARQRPQSAKVVQITAEMSSPIGYRSKPVWDERWQVAD